MPRKIRKKALWTVASAIYACGSASRRLMHNMVRRRRPGSRDAKPRSPGRFVFCFRGRRGAE